LKLSLKVYTNGSTENDNLWVDFPIAKPDLSQARLNRILGRGV
jgi:hypothetical protein